MVFSPYRMILSLCLLSPLLLGCVERTVPTEETAQAEPTVEPASPATVPGKGQESIPEEPSNLDIGIRAPALHIAEWVKGKSVEEYQPGKIYVVEFWATTCPPCKTSMPHISKLQETYGKEVTFVGVTRESVEIVQAFLQLPVDAALAGLGDTWNDLMRYTVAVDDDAATHAAFMYAAEESGIPTAFVVGFDGKIEWIGHPMGIDEPLQQIVARSWDRDAALAKRTEEKRKEEQFQARNLAFTQAMKNKDWDQALGYLDELAVDMPGSPLIKSYRLFIFNHLGRTEEAVQLLEELTQRYNQRAQPLNSMAWLIADNPVSKPPLLRAALKSAQRACELTGYANGEALDTIARLHWELGELEEAVTWQNRAVEAAPDVEELRETLENYKAEAAASSSVDTETNDVKPTAA